MTRLCLLPLLVAVLAGCDHKSPPTVIAVGGPVTTADPTVTTGTVPAPKDPAADSKKAAYEAEERRVAGLDTEVRLLDDADRQFVERTRAALKASPSSPLREPGDEVRLRRLARLFNRVDYEAHFIAYGERHYAGHLATLLGLSGPLREEFKMHYGLEAGNPAAPVAAALWMPTVRQAIEHVAARGLKGADPEMRAVLRDGGYARFLVNVKD